MVRRPSAIDDDNATGAVLTEVQSLGTFEHLDVLEVKEPLLNDAASRCWNSVHVQAHRLLYTVVSGIARSDPPDRNHCAGTRLVRRDLELRDLTA